MPGRAYGGVEDPTLSQGGVEIRTRIQESLRRAERYTSRYRRLDVGLLACSIVLSTVATVLAGGAAYGGETAVDALGGWRPVCAVVAICTALGTVTAGLHKAFHVTDRLTRSVACVAGLKALELEISFRGKDPAAAVEAYQGLLKDYSDCLV